MTPVLQLVTRDAIKNLFAVVNNLEALFKGWRLSGDVTTANQEQSVWLSLDVLEVVLKLAWNINTPFWDVARRHGICKHHFRVALKDKELLKGFELGSTWLGYLFLDCSCINTYTSLDLLLLKHLEFFLWDWLLNFFNMVGRIGVLFALFAFNVLWKLFKQPESLAGIAVKDDLSLKHTS